MNLERIFIYTQISIIFPYIIDEQSTKEVQK